MEPIKRKKVGLFTLGITLILIGAAILMNRYTDTEALKDLYLLWPAFLILLGMEFIATKVYYDIKKEDIQLSPSGISIFLAIVLLFTSVLWSGINGNPFGFRFNFGSNWHNLQYAHQVRETLTLETEGLLEQGSLVEITNVRGRVDVQPWDDRRIKVEAEVIVDTNFPDQVQIQDRSILRFGNGGRTTIEVHSPFGNSANDHRLHAVHLTVRVPRDRGIKIETRFGDATVSDVQGDITVDQAYGHVNLRNITGNAVVYNRHGRVWISEVTGTVQVENAHGEVLAESIGGDVRIVNSFSATTLRGAGGSADIRSRHGQVRIERVTGNVNAENEYNSTHCEDIAGDLTILSRHGAVSMVNIQGSIQAENSYSDIRLQNRDYDQADISAETSYNSIHTDKRLNMTVIKEANLQDTAARFGSGSQRIRLKNRHGEIRIELR